MNRIDIFNLARRNLWRRKLRTFLTTLGVLIGTTSIVVMISLGIGMKASITQDMERWGSLTMIRVTKGMIYDDEGNPLKDGKSLNDEAIEELKGLEGVKTVSPAYNAWGDAKYGRKVGGLDLVGIDPEAMPDLEFEASEGRLLESGDRNVIVVGSQVINNFRDEAMIRRMEKGGMIDRSREEEQDPKEMMDQRITMEVRNHERNQKKMFNFTVVGILEGDEDQNSYSAFAPIDDIKKMREFELGSQAKKQRTPPNRGRNSDKMRVSKRDPFDYDYILVSTEDVKVTSDLSQKIKDLGYRCWSMADNLKGIEETSRKMQAILGGIGGITLLVAAIGITNTMIMSIYERTREIGVMKVIGASFSDVYMMFITEAGLIGLFGGVFGLGLSYGVSHIINNLTQGFMGGGMDPAEASTGISMIPPWLGLFALVFSALIGVIAGLYPAHRAISLSPIKAIRNEQ